MRTLRSLYALTSTFFFLGKPLKAIARTTNTNVGYLIRRKEQERDLETWRRRRKGFRGSFSFALQWDSSTRQRRPNTSFGFFCLGVGEIEITLAALSTQGLPERTPQQGRKVSLWDPKEKKKRRKKIYSLQPIFL